MTVKLTWTPGTLATNQTVQYRLQGASTWTTYATINDNITSTYQVTLADDDYEFRILNSCTDCLCPEGSTSDNEGGCITTETVPATQSGTTVFVTRTPFSVYGRDGTRVYTTASFTAPFTLLNTANPFWIRQNIANFNSLTDAQKQSQDLNNGPVNRLAIWGRTIVNGNTLNNYEFISSEDLLPVDTWIGFDVCINIQSSKTYYVAIASDNRYRFILNNNLLLTDERGTTEVFTFLHIYPVQLPAGNHILTVQGRNDGANAGFGCEIFDLDNRGSLSVVDFLNAQTNYDNLNVIFTTRNVTQFTSNLFTCPQGYNQVNPTCTQVVCSRTTNTPCTQTPYSSNIASVNYTPPSGTVLIENLAGTGGSPFVSASIDDVSPAWFTINTGSLPLSSGQTANGTHSAFNGSFDVTVSNVGPGCCLVLYKGSTVYLTLPVSSSGVYTFSSATFSSSDQVKLSLVSTGCP